MKVKIGPHIDWIGPYQIASILQKVGLSEERCDIIGEWLSETVLGNVCEWIHSKRKRKIEVKLHGYDTWNMDSTLAIIALPMLKQLKEYKQGSPLVDDEDVPEELKSTSAPPKENDYDIDENHEKRWDWVIDEIIWTFEQLHPDNDWEDQYRSGKSDWKFVPCEDNPNLSEMQYGPDHTFQLDIEGLNKHNARIDNGTRLFGKYYRCLWT